MTHWKDVEAAKPKVGWYGVVWIESFGAPDKSFTMHAEYNKDGFYNRRTDKKLSEQPTHWLVLDEPSFRKYI